MAKGKNGVIEIEGKKVVAGQNGQGRVHHFPNLAISMPENE